MEPGAEKLCKKIKTMRLQGRFSDALKCLKEAERLYPDSVMLINEGYHLFSMKGDWNQAMTYAAQLSRLEPEKGGHFIKKGRSCVYLNKHKEAKEWFALGIQSLTGKSLKELEAEVEKRIIKSLALDSEIAVESTYLISGGKNNLGFFHHRIKGEPKEYLTKILEKRKKREAYFYQEVLKKLPELKDYCPSLVFSDPIGGIRVLTLEKVTFQEITKKEEDQQIRQFFLQTGRVEYSEELQDFLKVPNSVMRLGEGRSQGLVKYFESIHQKETNEQLFQQIREKISRKRYPISVKVLFWVWEKMVIRSGIYKNIIPEKDFAFIHGDLGPHNLLYESNSNRVKVIDWNSYRMGPKTYDIANFTIKSSRALPDMEENLSSMDEFLLYYAMSIIAFMGSGKKKFLNQYLPEAYTWIKKGKNSGQRIMQEQKRPRTPWTCSLLYGLLIGIIKVLIGLEGLKGALLWIKRKNPFN